ncbi:MAG: glutaredoxin 3 [Holosporales bacterium]
MSQPKVVIYSTRLCPYCDLAKLIMRKKKVEFEEIDASEAGVREAMIQRAGGRRTVPQIFIGDFHVGGYDDLHRLDKEGQLDRLLAGETIA